MFGSYIGRLKVTSTQCRWEVGQPVQITVARRSGSGSRARLCCLCSCFLGSMRYNLAVICHVDCTCGQRSFCVRHCLLCFLPFLLVGPPWLWGPKNFFTEARTRSRRPCVHGRGQRDRTQSRRMGTLYNKCQDIERRFYAPEYIKNRGGRVTKNRTKKIHSGTHLSPLNGPFCILHWLAPFLVGQTAF